MKKVLKTLFVAMLAVALIAAIGACSSDEADDEFLVFLIAHSPDSILDDGSFNQGAWQGVQRFLTANDLGVDRARFLQPTSADDVARLNLISQAVEEGADVIVLPGFHFVEAAASAQANYPETYFVILDATPAGGPNANTAAIHYAEHEAGFLAGYAAVREGLRELGFMGGIAVPAVVRFGHGFLQGAEHAAAQLGLDAGYIRVNFTYLGGFAPTPEAQTQAAAWFAGGTEVIFAAAGGAGGSVFAAAEAQNGLAIGVDVDQAGASERVLTSAMKALDVSVFDMLTNAYHGRFAGGVLNYNAANNGVALPMETSRFQNFTQAEYDAIFAQIASGAVVVNPSEDMGAIRSGLSLIYVNEM